MKLVIQRVIHASVEVDGKLISAIGPGIMVLVGIADTDTEADILKLAAKTCSLRIFDDDNGVMNLSIAATGGDVLAVSQFTLLAMTEKGNRPSYIHAARPEKALPLYELYCKEVERILGREVRRGVFGADMKVSLLNSGPVTIIMDTAGK